MGDGEKSSGIFEGTYNKLVCQEDVRADEEPFYSNQERQRGIVNDKEINSDLLDTRCLILNLLGNKFRKHITRLNPWYEWMILL